MNTACFTGHRRIINEDLLETDLISKLERAIVNGGITDYYAGGAYGFDALAEKVIISLRETRYPHIKLHLILPCRSDHQTMNWKRDDAYIYNSILETADTIEYVAYNYYSGCMQARNARLIKLADYCFCYLDVHNQRSGTAQTVRMAQNKGIGVYNFYRL